MKSITVTESTQQEMKKVCPRKYESIRKSNFLTNYNEVIKRVVFYIMTKDFYHHFMLLYDTQLILYLYSI